jgi:hypothetical protein
MGINFHVDRRFKNTTAVAGFAFRNVMRLAVFN